MSYPDLAGNVPLSPEASYPVTTDAVDPYVLAVAAAWRANADLPEHTYVDHELQAADIFTRVIRTQKLEETDALAIPGTDDVHGRMSAYGPIILEPKDGATRRAVWLRDTKYVFDDGCERGATHSLGIRMDGRKFILKRMHLQTIDRLARGPFVPRALDERVLPEQASRLLGTLIDAETAANAGARRVLEAWRRQQRRYAALLGEVASAVGVNPLAHPMTGANLMPFVADLPVMYESQSPRKI